MRKIIGWLLLVLLMGFVGYLVYVQVRPVRFVVRDDIITISGDSMEPNLKNGSQYQVTLCKQGECNHVFERGEIIVYRQAPYDQEAIKRIVGLPGETITITDGHVFVNHRQLHETYLAEANLTELQDSRPSLEIALGSDEFFVLGDNRSESHDSRQDGAVKRESILSYIH